jgi:hypothetical protein
MVEVWELNRGDEVGSEEGGKWKWSPVVFVKASWEEYEFVKVIVRASIGEGEEERFKVKVTEDHGMIVDKEGRESLVKAVKVKEGEKVKTSVGWGKVESVERLKSRGKVTVATKSGSVLAGGVLVSTICGDQFEEGESFAEVVSRWRKIHVF